MEKNTQFDAANCLRVVVYGPESTGKTTLVKALAAHYQSEWVPEFARIYLQEKWDLHKEVCSLEDLIHIAEGQLEQENIAAQKTNELLFCDTNILVTKVWSETHFNGYCSPAIESLFAQTQYDFYFLTNIDVPWEKDDLRDRPAQREEMFAYFKQQLDRFKLPYIILEGSKQKRLGDAIQVIDDLCKKADDKKREIE